VPSGEAVRAFIALEIPGLIRARLAELQGVWRREIPGVRWQKADTLHLTLRFLGPTRVDQLEHLRETLGLLANRHGPVEARVGELGTFPPRGSPRVLFLGVEHTAGLQAIASDCELQAVAAGLPPETRPFRSHLTLGRWRDRTIRPRLPSIDLGRVVFTSLVLFASELLRDGARHTPLATYHLPG
jgi:2'-5' RNA ligase